MPECVAPVLHACNVARSRLARALAAAVGTLVNELDQAVAIRGRERGPGGVVPEGVVGGRRWFWRLWLAAGRDWVALERLVVTRRRPRSKSCSTAASCMILSSKP